MNQKERAVLTIKALIKYYNLSDDAKEYLMSKLDAIRTLARPEVLLDEDALKAFNAEVENLRKKGEII